MIMDSQDQTMGSKELAHIIKGKRTKRPRSSLPLTLAIITSSSSYSAGESGGERDRRIYNNSSSSSSPRPSTSFEFTERTGEEEDMANCLILLARGNETCKLAKPVATAATAVNREAGLYVYQCKTCDRRFPSFQALGGHRASHRKQKPGNLDHENKKVLTMVRLAREEENGNRSNISTSTTLSLQVVNERVLWNPNYVKSNKVHECSVCGAEFSSGQALGGHMRRHRAFASTSTTTRTTTAATMSLGRISSPDRESQESKKPRNSLQLDLNLPAPEDDHLVEPKFHFASKEQVLVFTASPLVDCHY
ncbi:ZINC FINGER PROTEIN ZAT5 [Salix koriyanagi]|uniref:ZINC FINGER PROTEIN ZAT5 n=1 Tax=Salix koriyanagi TaxID=2511006 RepID=A0A9Q0VDG3_9ROSI|nr:ZINC FINGER PROTEIN ZAT5 [Salix koriyanagi]